MIFIKSVFFKDGISVEGDYEWEIPSIRNMITKKQVLEFHTPVTFFTGDNGTGKSTLLECIAASYGFNPEGGTRNFCFSTRESHSNIFEHLVISKTPKRAKDGFFYRAESFYNVSTEVDRLDKIGRIPLSDSYGGVSLHERSHGEALLSLMKYRLGGRGLYILDEPESALSPMSLMKLICIIDDLVKADSQFIIATHSPILMSYPNSEIYLFGEDELRSVKLEDTDHFILTKAFIEKPQKMISNLLD